MNKTTCSFWNCRSFGVLLWEIVSYGGTPLDDVSMEGVVNAAENGTLRHARLELMSDSVIIINAIVSLYQSLYLLLSLHIRPPDCSDHLYQLMSDCLKNNCDDRPGFNDIVLYLSNNS